ncbi:MAG: class I SAM-dependent methyltransferase [Oscillatoria sp. PMC 1051.18]|nr:class I SAM-dependent methyltransferase [Oscillatoria sp. PMC 1050.18]MEC5029453.1 class I SAM-dependent methyltransferase [Oscillatoria sp. PMC 1051.18]
MDSVNNATENENARALFNEWAFAYPDDRSSELWLEFVGKYFLEYLPTESRILDVGCGRGELVSELITKGYQVTGLDLSERMLHFACKNVPEGKFMVGDICSLELPPTFHAIVAASCVFNYILSLEDLKKAFRNVYSALLENGWFAFDLSEGEIVSDENTVVEEMLSDFSDDYAWLKRSIYDLESKLWQTQHVTFQLSKGKWQRKDVDCEIKAYSRTEIESALAEIGFEKVIIHDVTEDVPISELRDTRIVYIFRKP